MPEAETRDEGWFLAFFRALGGWRIDVFDAPQRSTKGGAEDVTAGLPAFLRRWQAQKRGRKAVVIVSPKRLLLQLPEEVRREVIAGVPPPGQWNAHRQTFLREIGALVEREIGRETLRQVARSVADDDAVLDFEIARACAEATDNNEILRLLTGHPRERSLRVAWIGAGKD